MPPANTFITNCRLGSSDICPEATISLSLLGFCYTLFADGTPKYVVNTTGMYGAFSFEVDIMQDDYSPKSNSQGAGIMVNESDVTFC